MKNKSAKVLPKTARGTVHAEFKRCGKPNCKCRTRGELHGAYFYQHVRVNGKQMKRYLRRDEAEQMRLACIARQKIESTQRAELRAGRQAWRVLLASLRQLRVDFISG